MSPTTTENGDLLYQCFLFDRQQTTGSQDPAWLLHRGRVCVAKNSLTPSEFPRSMHPELTDVIATKGQAAKGPGGLQGDASNNSDADDADSSEHKTCIDPSPRTKVTFNVGGVIFQTFYETVQHVAKLQEASFKSHFDEVNQEYFFDRDPEVFRSILNYWRTGKLHLPLYRCGPSVRDELMFWGLEELDIEPCCWNNYNTGIATTNSLAKIRRDSLKDKELDYIQQPTTQLDFWRLHAWYLLTTPSFSKASKIYEICAVFFAALAIFSMCASTTEFFQIAVPKEAQDNKSTNDVRMSITHNLKFNYHLNLGPLKDENYQVSPVLNVVDFICLVFFTLEYLARLLSTSKPWKFVRSTSAVIDILAVLPDYLQPILQSVRPNPGKIVYISILMVLSLLRINRIFRIAFRIPALNVMAYSLRGSSQSLYLMMVFVLMGTVVFGSMMYYIDDNRIFTSIPRSFWWAIIMMTTVGYGDMVPLTAVGQILGSLTAICGVLLVAFNIPPMVSSFLCYSVLTQYRANRKYLRKRKKLGIPVEDIDVHDNRVMIHKPLQYV